MANEKPAAPAKPAETPAPAEPAKKSPMLKMGIIVGAVIALELGTVGLTMVVSGGPKKIIAEVPTTAPAAAVERDVEVKLVDAKLPNNLSGRLWLYDLQVVATTEEKNKDKMTELLSQHLAAIHDRIRTIIASSDPKSLSEPGLETLRRQIGYQLEQDLGKNLIKDIFIPKCTPLRGEY